MEPLVWLNRTISLHTSEPGASFPGTDTELWEKRIWAGNFSVARHEAVEGVLMVQDMSL